MRRREFLDLILNGIAVNFDVYRNYRFDGKQFDAYAYSYHQVDEVGEHHLWEAKSFEHLFVVSIDDLTLDEIMELKEFAITRLEPHFVRGDGKHPMKHHTCTYLSILIITKNAPTEGVCKIIENLSWSKNYLLSARGFSELRLACVTPRNYQVISNKSAETIGDFLQELLLHIDHFEDD